MTDWLWIVCLLEFHCVSHTERVCSLSTTTIGCSISNILAGLAGFIRSTESDGFIYVKIYQFLWIPASTPAQTMRKVPRADVLENATGNMQYATTESKFVLVTNVANHCLLMNREILDDAKEWHY